MTLTAGGEIYTTSKLLRHANVYDIIYGCDDGTKISTGNLLYGFFDNKTTKLLDFIFVRKDFCQYYGKPYSLCIKKPAVYFVK